jgi:hypothetical protein
MDPSTFLLQCPQCHLHIAVHVPSQHREPISSTPPTPQPSTDDEDNEDNHPENLELTQRLEELRYMMAGYAAENIEEDDAEDDEQVNLYVFHA